MERNYLTNMVKASDEHADMFSVTIRDNSGSSNKRSDDDIGMALYFAIKSLGDVNYGYIVARLADSVHEGTKVYAFPEDVEKMKQFIKLGYELYESLLSRYADNGDIGVD